MNWSKNNYNEATRQSAIDLLNGCYKSDNYLISLVEKVYKYEMLNELKTSIPYRRILINTLYFKVLKTDFASCKELFINVRLDTLPLISTSLIFALEDVSFQIQHKNSVKEKDELYCKIKNLFQICKDLIERYNKNLKLINNCSLLPYNSDKLNYSNIRYEIANYRTNLMFAYKKINDIEADYISILSTGNTWQENKEFYNKIDNSLAQHI